MSTENTSVEQRLHHLEEENRKQDCIIHGLEKQLCAIMAAINEIDRLGLKQLQEASSKC